MNNTETADKVKVRFSVSLAGSYSRDVEMTREQFDDIDQQLDTAKSWELADLLSDWMDWHDVVAEIDDCEEFEIIGEAS